MTVLLLILSIILCTGRHLLSKNLSSTAFGTKTFFKRQTILFLFGALAALLFGISSLRMPSGETLIYAAIHSVLLILAQWFYTAALSTGNMAICSTVYSMGFIIPTLSGAIFWSEPFSVFDLAGILCALSAVICSGASKNTDKASVNKGYFLPLLVSMLASGGLGIMQKLQQKSSVAEESTAFLFIAFLFGAAISFLVSLTVSKGDEKLPSRKSILTTAGVGITFGGYNLLNVILAGLLPSAVFFPVFNVAVIALTIIFGIILFKERIQKKDILVLLLGGTSILLLTLF